MLTNRTAGLRQRARVVEAKAAGIELRDKHFEQASSYASRGNYRWVILTNGVVWNLYHLTFEEGIEYERAFSVNLEEDDFDKATELLALLHRNSVKKGDLEEYWRRRTALSPGTVGRALMHEEVLKVVRREIKREEGFLLDVEDIATAIQAMFTPESRELIGPVRVKRKRKTSRNGPEAATAPPKIDDEPAPSPPAGPATKYGTRRGRSSM